MSVIESAMKSQHLSISFAEFEQMPHPFGWKVEYYNDKAYFMPREYGIKTKLTLPLAFVETTYFIQPLDSDYKLRMIQAFYEAFCHSVEFCDWTKKDIQKHAEKNINDYLAGVRGEPQACSVMAIEPKTQQLIGLALVLINRKQHYELDLLFVKSNYQRQGLATAMVLQITQQLHRNGI